MAVGTFFFVSTLLLYIFTLLFLPSSSVYLSYFIIGVPMHECLGKHSCMRSTFPIAVLNGPCFTEIVLALAEASTIKISTLIIITAIICISTSIQYVLI